MEELKLAEPAFRDSESRERSESFHKGSEVQRGRGRPKGSKNRPKSLLPTELAGEILLQMKDILPPDHFEYIRKVVREGAAVSAQREAQIMLLLLGRNLLPAILAETKKSNADELYFRRDVTERLKVWNSILNVVHNIEKASDNESDNKQKPIAELFAKRGVDGGRIKVLIGYESGSLGGSDDGVGRPELESGTISSELPDGSFDVPNSEQVETVRIFPADSDRDDSLGDNETEL